MTVTGILASFPRAEVRGNKREDGENRSFAFIGLCPLRVIGDQEEMLAMAAFACNPLDAVIQGPLASRG